MVVVVVVGHKDTSSEVTKGTWVGMGFSLVISSF